MKKKSIEKRLNSPLKRAQYRRATSKILNAKEKRLQNINITEALYRKYSGSQKHYYLTTIDALVNVDLKNGNNIQFQTIDSYIDEKQYLSKYLTRRIAAFKFEQTLKVFQYHRQLPRLFILDVSQTINKCHHRKRLIEYYRLAKQLNLTVKQESFSSFLYTLNLTKYKNNKQFQNILNQISSYHFSTDSAQQENPESTLISQIQCFLRHFKDKEELIWQTPLTYKNPLH